MRYLTSFLVLMLLTGCTFKEEIPPKAPKTKYKKSKHRSYAKMKRKWKHIRKPMKVKSVSKQGREMRSEIDALLEDTIAFKRKIQHFEKAHPVRKKLFKKEKQRSKKIGAKGVNNETALKYY